VKEEIERLAKEYEAAAGGIIHSVEEAGCRNGSKERDNEIIPVGISVRGQLLARGRKAPRKSSEATKKKIGIQEGDIRR
jgi:hypothetical protein